MKAFCPNCGTQNEGMAGGRVTCKACTASFEIPRGEAGVTPPPELITPPAPPPPKPVVVVAQSAQFPTGYVGPPPTGFSRGTGGSGPINPLAIVSLVCGILCCTPFAIAALITGAIAQNQIASSNGQQRGREFAIAGMVLGGASVAMSVLFGLLGVLGRLN